MAGMADEQEREVFSCSCAGACTTIILERDPFDEDHEHTWVLLRQRIDSAPGRLRRAWATLRGRDVDISDMVLSRTDVERMTDWLTDALKPPTPARLPREVDAANDVFRRVEEIRADIEAAPEFEELDSYLLTNALRASRAATDARKLAEKAGNAELVADLARLGAWFEAHCIPYR